MRPFGSAVVCLGLSLGLIANGCASHLEARTSWDTLAKVAPLQFAEPHAELWLAPMQDSDGSHTRLCIVRFAADTAFAVQTALAGVHPAQSAGSWARLCQTDCIVFNAGFYAEGGAHVGWLKSAGQWLAPQKNSDWQGFFASAPQAANLPQSMLVDLQADPDKVSVKDLYANVSQSMMLLDNKHQLRTRDSRNKAARTALATDTQGRVLVVVSEDGITLAGLAQALRAPDLQIVHALNLDGGLESQLAVASGTTHIQLYARHGGRGVVPAALAPLLAPRALPSVWVAQARPRQAR